jgi:hypothetical protein
MSERFNPYDLNDVAKVDEIIEKNRDKNPRRNLVHLSPGVEFNPYNLNHVAMVNRETTVKPRS